MARSSLLLIIVGLLVLALSACPMAPSVRYYSRLVIETYPPASGSGVTDTTLELYDPSGLLAFDNDPANPKVPADHHPSALIDYQPAEPLPSGTVLFVKIYSAAANQGPYSIRIFELGGTALLPDDLPAYSYTGILGTNDSDSPYEGYEVGLGAEPWTDSYAPGEGPAEMQLGAGNPLHRFLEPDTDVDWVRITLP